MHHRISFMLIALLLIMPPLLSAEQKLIVQHYQQQERYAFGLKVLNLALSKLNIPFEIHTPEDQAVNEGRGELQVIKGQLDLQWISTTVAREKNMIAIKVPIYQGILGLRLLLVSRERYEQFNNIRTLNDLRSYVGGHGKHWADLVTYPANNLSVETNVNYENLLKQLIEGRFDHIHRGLNEIWAERTRYANKLVIADNVMLYYPQPVYFFVTKHRPELAEYIDKGLKIAINDGSFKSLFFKTFSKFIQQGNLNNRTLIVLNNPAVPVATPILDTSWWLPPKFKTQLRTNTNRPLAEQ